MKYATLALIATASASTAAWKMTPMATCTAAEEATAKTNEAKYKKSWTAAQLKDAKTTLKDAWAKTSLGKKVAADMVTLEACWKKNDVTLMSMTEAKCGKEWNTAAPDINSLTSKSCAWEMPSGGDTGLIIGIIVGVVVCLGCVGAGYMHHKKKATDAMYSDDLYTAFVDNETA
jgi:hypothetical protein